MKSIYKRLCSLSGLARLFVINLGLLSALSLAGCSLPLESILIDGASLGGTKTAISAQQTLVGQKAQQESATAEAMQATLAVQAQNLQATQLALEATASAQGTPATLQGPTYPPEETGTPGPPQPSPLSEMERAKILLYEDMAGNRDAKRYVKETLDRMGLPYDDVGSAKGHLKTQLLSVGPDGSGWDLVIVASEDKSEKLGISGEYFEYLNKTLDQGAAVILETWSLDQTAKGAAGPLLSRCGVEFEMDWEKVAPMNTAVFPLNDADPILNEPNSGISLTKVSGFWWDSSGKTVYDIGDWMRLSPDSDARLVIGTLTSQSNVRGTVAVCLDGRFILQTFSSHQISFDAMKLLWENYIYNALKARLEGKT